MCTVRAWGDKATPLHQFNNSELHHLSHKIADYFAVAVEEDSVCREGEDEFLVVDAGHIECREEFGVARGVPSTVAENFSVKFRQVGIGIDSKADGLRPIFRELSSSNFPILFVNYGLSYSS